MEIESILCDIALGDEFSFDGEKIEVSGWFASNSNSSTTTQILFTDPSETWSTSNRESYTIPGAIKLAKDDIHSFKEVDEQGNDLPKAFIVLRKTEKEFARIVPTLWEVDDGSGNDPFETKETEVLVSKLPNDGSAYKRNIQNIKAGSGQQIDVFYNFIKLDHKQLSAWNGCSFICGEPFPSLEVPHDLDGPGFIIRNETVYDIDISLSQVGPLYWETIKPGKIWYQGSGAVWFTIKARVNLSGEEEFTDWNAIIPVAKEVGSFAVSVGTGGAFAGFQGGLWAARSTQAGLKLAGTGVYLVSKQLAIDAATGAGMDAFKTNLWSESYCYTSLGGCYAGYPLTTRKKEKMYRIVGGPKLPCYDKQNNRIQISPSEPLRIIEPD